MGFVQDGATAGISYYCLKFRVCYRSITNAGDSNINETWPVTCQAGSVRGTGVAAPVSDAGARRWVTGQHHALASFSPGKETRLGGLRGLSGWARKISPPPWFESRIVRP
jgi:hypothetical protein